MKATLYVSRADVGFLGLGEGGIQALVKGARTRNEALGVTGALIFTGDHFAQWLEGPPSHVDALMDRIAKDRRHRWLRRFDEDERGSRLFPDWSLAYIGASTWVDRHIRPLFTDLAREAEVERTALIHLLQSFAVECRAGPR